MGSSPTIFSLVHSSRWTRPQRATAVAVQDGDIIAVGELDDVVAIVGDDHELDETFLDNTVITGFIDQHLHPFWRRAP